MPVLRLRVRSNATADRHSDAGHAAPSGRTTPGRVA